MTLHQFFGVLLGKAPYRIESAPIKLMPLNGYNAYLPVPFQHSCRITLHKQGSCIDLCLVDGQLAEVRQPRHRHPLPAARAIQPRKARTSPWVRPCSARSVAKASLPACFTQSMRHDYRDMIWHTGGDTWLIDGETGPHVLRGIGSEDVFGHSFGMYPEMSDWTGAPHVVGLNAECSEVVAYRFFGADSVSFNSSLSLRFGTRANDMESVLYYYREAGSDAPKVETPGRWTLSGPFECQTFDDFRTSGVSRRSPKISGRPSGNGAGGP